MNRAPVSIVVTSFNTKDYLRDCLKSAFAQTNGESDEVIVVDNCSPDGSAEMVQREFPQARLFVSNKNRGFSYACNKGCLEAKNDLILFSNSDLIFPPGSIEKMLNKITTDPRIGILSPILIAPDGLIAQMTLVWEISIWGEMTQKLLSPAHIAKYPFIRRLAAHIQRHEQNVPIVAGACMLIRREVLKKIDGFDEQFELYFEDADLCSRCRRAGYFVRFTPDIQVLHSLGQSGKSAPKKIALVYRQSQITYYRKHHTKLNKIILKIYLALKFSINRHCWTDAVFREWILNILLERKKILLSDSL